MVICSRRIKFGFLVVLLLESCVLWADARPSLPIKVACIGNSITYGYGVDAREKNSYPAQLQRLLGEGYQVSNFGVSGTTLLSRGNLPYVKNELYQKALESRPDIVLIKLGTNDSKLVNRVLLGEFEKDYADFIGSFRQLASHPRIVLLIPVPSFKEDTAQIWDPIIRNKIIPLVQKVAYDNKCEIINLYPLLIEKPALFPDKIHPNTDGATVIAKRLSELILQKRDTTFAILPSIKDSVRMSSFYGYACADFRFNSRECKIVSPKWSAEGHPWVWRARFWGHEPQTDIAMLERGYHIVYCDVVELYGNKQAIGYWDAFYRFVHKAGLSSKVALEGMSRGGVYVYNWAAVNPKKVACIYVDNPVLDLKSWPGGKGKGPGSKDDWEKFKVDYGFTSEEAALKFSGSPINKVKKIVRGKYPMLHVCGDADEAVPMEENTIPFEQKVKALHGNITVIHKPGFKHHPHSLPDPTPIVAFFLSVTY
ncbi:MAG: GDSL-type esterase/lipase family protein [Chitinophagaceae bacterium]